MPSVELRYLRCNDACDLLSNASPNWEFMFESPCLLAELEMSVQENMHNPKRGCLGEPSGYMHSLVVGWC